MKRKCLPYLAFLLMLVSLFACQNPYATDKNQRTVIVYIDADNNLAKWGHLNLEDIIASAKHSLDAKNRLMVYFNQSSGKTLYEVKHTDWGFEIDTVAIKQYQFENSLEKGAVREVISDAIATAPAEEYVLVLWSHSTGWLPEGIAIEESSFYRNAHMLGTKTFGRDGNYQISYEHLGEALQGLGLDLILIDACFGACAEALYDLREVVDYVVVSPTEILESGFPYHRITSLLLDESLSMINLGKALCAQYIDYYLSYEYQGTPYPYASISLIDMKEMQPLAQRCRDIISAYGHTEVSHASVQALENRSKSIYFDLYHYLQQMIPSQGDTLWQAFDAQFKQTVLHHGHTDYLYSILGKNGLVKQDNSHGLSSYIPRPGDSNFFTRCDEAYFNTNWARFIYQ